MLKFTTIIESLDGGYCPNAEIETNEEKYPYYVMPSDELLDIARTKPGSLCQILSFKSKYKRIIVQIVEDSIDLTNYVLRTIIINNQEFTCFYHRSL